jgi:chitinase
MNARAWCSALVASLSIAVAACSPAPAAPAGKYVIGYYPSWAAERGSLIKDLPADQLTHINYAFSNVSGAGECILGDPAADVQQTYSAAESVDGQDDSQSAAFQGNFNQLLELKKKYRHLKVLVSIGGWSWSGNFSSAAQDEASRQRFAASCIDLYLKRYSGVFDGLDIDWEFPVSGGLKPGNPQDKKNFTLLLAEVRRQLDDLEAADNRDYLLTIAAPIGPGTIRNIEPAAIAPTVDWINLMSYDFHGTWENSTNFNAPLFETSADPGDAALNVDSAVQTYLSAGVVPEKLVLGVPFYGRGWAGVPDTDNGLYQPASGAAHGTWEAGAYEYRYLQENFLSQFQRYWDGEAYVPWLYDPVSRTFISYDDAESLQAKAGYARDQGLAGVMIWELSQGDESLLEAIHQGLATGGPARPTLQPVALLPRPFEKQIQSVSGIAVDGKPDDWSIAPDFVLNEQSQVVYSLNPTSWDGPEDLSAEAWAGWAPQGLFFAFKVTDDMHVQTKANSDLWHGDHVELQFDTQLDKDYGNPGMNDDDYQIGLSLGDLRNVPPVAYAWFNGPEAPGVVDTIQMAYSVTSEGYFLEAFIPKEALAGIDLAAGATFGMNITPSDADSVARGQEVMLSTSAIRTYADPRTFGKITLVK